MKKINIYVFLDNIPFASEGIIYGLEQDDRTFVKSFYPKEFISKRKNIDTNIRLKECNPIDYKNDFSKFEKQEKANLPGALFISFGYIHNSYLWASKLAKSYNGKCFVISERPTCVKKFRKIKTPFVLLKHAILRKRVEGSIDKLFVTGESSISTFAKLGWKKNKLFSYYYCPLIFDDNICKSNDIPVSNKGLNFIYSGRLTFRSKSPQRLIPYFKKNKSDKLFVVGNYGDDVKKMHSLCKGLDNVIFLGNKPLEEVVNCFYSADCVLIPSTVDGWNINVNLAIASKTPCIITNNSGSDQIIKKFGNGIVTRNNGTSFRKAIKSFSKKPLWYKQKAEDAKYAITPKRAANDLIMEFLK